MPASDDDCPSAIAFSLPGGPCRASLGAADPIGSSVYDAKVMSTERHEAIAKSLPLSIDRSWMISPGRVCERLMIRTSSSSRCSAGETVGNAACEPFAL
jgi:hypothetical protein